MQAVSVRQPLEQSAAEVAVGPARIESSCIYPVSSAILQTNSATKVDYGKEYWYNDKDIIIFDETSIVHYKTHLMVAKYREMDFKL